MSTSQRHAYCIIAHTDIYCLQKLITCIDDPRNDIFVLYDRKSDMFNHHLSAEKSFLKIISKEDSIDIRWGAYSQVEAELIVLKTAALTNKYDYYHLISGQDLPIKSQDEIHSFFSKLPKGTNLIGYKDSTARDRRNTLKRIVPFHLFRYNLRNKNKYVRLFFRSIEEISSHIQRILGLKICKTIQYKKGCNWVSITDEFTRYVLSQTDFIKNILGKAILCDELLMQTLAWNSQFKDTIYNCSEEYEGCMRDIDWSRGKPYVWKEEDLKHLLNSDKLFARKFSSDIDKKIIDEVSYRFSYKIINVAILILNLYGIYR